MMEKKEEKKREQLRRPEEDIGGDIM